MGSKAPQPRPDGTGPPANPAPPPRNYGGLYHQAGVKPSGIISRDPALRERHTGRLKRLMIADEILLGFLNGNFSGCHAYNSGDVIPGDAEIVNVFLGPSPKTVEILLSSESFPEIEYVFRADIPEIRPMFTRLD